MRKKVFIRAPILTRSGYGEQSRFALRALRSVEQDLVDIYIQPINWGNTSWICDDEEEKKYIDATIKKTIEYMQAGTPLNPSYFDIALMITIPGEFERLAPINVGYTAGIETNKVSHEWLIKLNQELDSMIVVSNHSKMVFESTTYEGHNSTTKRPHTLRAEKPINVANYPVKKFSSLPEIELDIEHDINFVCVAQNGPRKNIPNTIKWFVEEFYEDEVGLVIKTNQVKNCLMDRENTFHDLRNLLNSIIMGISQYRPNVERKCAVYLLHGDMTDAEMHSLYAHEKISAFVCLSHGEGFGLPFFEAAYSGIPVVAVGYSGQCDFLFDENQKGRFYNVAFDMNKIQEQARWKDILLEDSCWAFPREQSAKKHLRQCYDDILNQEGHAADAPAYALELNERFSEEKMYDTFLTHLLGEKYSQQFDVDEWLAEMDEMLKEVE